MPRKKGGAPSYRGGKGSNATGGYPRNQTQYPSASPGPRHYPAVAFSLADEARHTGQSDHSSWNGSTKLRSKPVSFVSAGASAPLELLEENLSKPENPDIIQPSDSDRALDEPQTLPQDQPTIAPVDEAHSPVEHGKGDAQEEPVLGPEELEQEIQDAGAKNDVPFFFDLEGDTSLSVVATETIIVPNRPDTAESDSSEEVILFKGRDTTQPAPVTSSMTMSQIRTEIQVVEDQIQSCPTAPEKGLTATNSRGRRRKGGHRQARSSDDIEDEMVADYIDNMRQSGEIGELLTSDQRNRRDLGGSLSDDSTDMRETTDAEVNHLRQTEIDGGGPEYASESELDDETLAKLIAGQETDTLGLESQVAGLISSDSESSDAVISGARGTGAADDFDFMDWDRPSLRKKRKGKAARGQVAFGLSDSELEENLQNAFKNDRLKKAQRKQQREELRALGQLGQNSKDPEDMTVKYPTGMTMEQVAEEIRAFMLNKKETISLPPMDPHARKIIHEIASKFNIKSKSTGKGTSRRPTLNRTLRTLPYVESTFDQVTRRIHRRYLPRPDQKGKPRGKAQVARPKASGDSAVKVRNGEIVGGAAPELGTDNRGRVMLEKMGWSSGTALGSTNNKGILQPVSQMMKTNKAGLG